MSWFGIKFIGRGPNGREVGADCLVYWSWKLMFMYVFRWPYVCVCVCVCWLVDRQSVVSVVKLCVCVCVCVCWLVDRQSVVSLWSSCVCVCVCVDWLTGSPWSVCGQAVCSVVSSGDRGRYQSSTCQLRSRLQCSERRSEYMPCHRV